ncbi:phosphoribosyl-AMP cyclohydrolase [Pseudohongiella spirulinae]|uniref:Phosphoribosyl-AMP cyclohydrolase n=1 Tax=Pseudohongiella spirulinae TaxID=1249552 RepID=A0A0S2KAV6_9GAMM|nr:phosphoribosyl-AMP cyclohydrolase [Pseudohongiella spirulinae]ALO45188.1 phosphoribosyl-AMP cyclohydrolase [Pseudohongiella spirulinae]
MKEHTEGVNINWLDQVKWDDKGLVAVVAQDFKSGRILMVAWANRQALSLSQQEGRAIYWSRSRQKLWRKGEESGNVQLLHHIQLDCDGDAVCYQVEQIGDVACHTGRQSCFYRQLTASDSGPQWLICEDVLKDPAQMYQTNAKE